MRAKQVVGDPVPPNCELIEVHVGELRQLFNSIDPSPFRQKDLDPKAEEFIVGWGQEAPRGARLALAVYVDRTASLAGDAAVLGDAIKEFFSNRSQVSRRQLRHLFHIGRVSLSIGLVFLAVSIGLGDLVANAWSGQRVGELLRESLLIGGWVAMWRPLEIFLYEWWPIRAEGRLYDRLSAMPVQLASTGDAPLP